MLQIKELHKRFGATVAVDGISLSIEKGEIFGLLGPNGAGKSTTVNMAVGALQPDSGEICIAGQGAPSKPEVRRMIGVAPQELALYDEMSGVENLHFLGSLYGLSRTTLRTRIGEVLEEVGLQDRGGDRVGGYSGGMKRRLNIAAALIHNPSLLFLDEPTAGVDPQSRNKILETTERLAKEGTTIVYTTHYMEEAERVCHRVAIVDGAKIKAIDTVANLISEHGGQDTLVVEFQDETLRLQTEKPLEELNRLAAERAFERFHLERPTLEQVFLNLTGRSLRD
ncbi:MAG: ABC transporter ATP-binding protein [Kofleriaceae bacterium]|nr:ABC transporter ATP-binding protein [Kofleriaceae bacterium]